MNITLNGEAKTLPGALTITQLIEHVGAEPTQIAIERNGAIIPKSQHASTAIAAGDRIELVRFIGGG